MSLRVDGKINAMKYLAEMTNRLTDNELLLLLDIVRDRRMVPFPSDSINRSNLSRSKEMEMYDICELFNHEVLFEPERINGFKKVLFIKSNKISNIYKQQFR